MSRYEPLGQFLANQNAAETPLTFKEVERIIRRSLPSSARRHPAWWANTRTHSQAGSWLDAGWRTERVELVAERVVFVRDQRAVSPMVARPERGDVVSVPFDAFNGAGLHLVDSYAEAHACDRGAAIAALINAAGVERRMAMLEPYQRQWTGKLGADSVDLIREDRDAR